MASARELVDRRSSVRNHPLYSHILSLRMTDVTLNIRLSCYNKYTNMNLCCFIPGKIIDEIMKIIRRNYAGRPKTTSSYEILKELTDLVCMATEHFKSEISHILDKKISYSETQNESSINQSELNQIDSKLIVFTNIFLY